MRQKILRSDTCSDCTTFPIFSKAGPKVSFVREKWTVMQSNLLDSLVEIHFLRFLLHLYVALNFPINAKKSLAHTRIITKMQAADIHTSPLYRSIIQYFTCFSLRNTTVKTPISLCHKCTSAPLPPPPPHTHLFD